MPLNYKPLGAAPSDQRLGRLIPDDDQHIKKYPYTAIKPAAVDRVEKILLLPVWHKTHNQGGSSACVPHASSMERSITNSTQNRLLRIVCPARRYDPMWLWDQAKLADEWSDTNPGDNNGTSVRAAYDVLRVQGHRIIKKSGIKINPSSGFPEITDPNEAAPDPAQGVATNRWATTVDQIRTAVDDGLPVCIGVNWYSNFDDPVPKRGMFGQDEFWIGQGRLGTLEGGHSICIYGASARRQAFKAKNNWLDYPLVWLPYETMNGLLREDGEACLVVDR